MYFIRQGFSLKKVVYDSIRKIQKEQERDSMKKAFCLLIILAFLTPVLCFGESREIEKFKIQNAVEVGIISCKPGFIRWNICTKMYKWEDEDSICYISKTDSNVGGMVCIKKDKESL